MAALAGCGSSLQGSWTDNSGKNITFRSGDSVSLRDANGSDYSGKWREVGKGRLEITLAGLMGLGGPQVCSFEIRTDGGPTNLFLNDCAFQGIYHKQ